MSFFSVKSASQSAERKRAAKSLPADVRQMVEKNNLVLAIKTLVADEGISFDDAKARVDAYESELKRHQPYPTQPAQSTPPSQSAQPTKPMLDTTQGIPSLQAGLDKHLADIGYVKPLLPYWAKRVLLMLVVLVAAGLMLCYCGNAEMTIG